MVVHHFFPVPVGGVVPACQPEQIPGKLNYDVIPLNPWTWSKPSIIDQLSHRQQSTNTGVPDDPPADPSFVVTPTPYSTGFKDGQLMRLDFISPTKSFI